MAKRPSATQAAILRQMAAGATVRVWNDVGHKQYAYLVPDDRAKREIPRPAVHLGSVWALERAGWSGCTERRWRDSRYALTDAGRDALTEAEA